MRFEEQKEKGFEELKELREPRELAPREPREPKEPEEEAGGLQKGARMSPNSLLTFGERAGEICGAAGEKAGAGLERFVGRAEDFQAETPDPFPFASAPFCPSVAIS